MPRAEERTTGQHAPWLPRISPNSGTLASTTVARYGGMSWRPCFAAVAGPRCLLGARSMATCKRTGSRLRGGAATAVDTRGAAGWDKTRNSGEIEREPSPPAGSRSRTRPSHPPVLAHRPDLCDSDNRRRLIRVSGLTTERLATTALRSRLPNLVPTHDRGPRPLRGRSTWLLLSRGSTRRTPPRGPSDRRHLPDYHLRTSASRKSRRPDLYRAG